MSSQEQLPDDVPRRERDSCKGPDDDRGEDVDAQPPLAPDGTPSRRAARSASRYSDPVTRTAPLGPAIDRARATAAPGSRSVSVLSNHRLASVASSSADSARGCSTPSRRKCRRRRTVRPASPRRSCRGRIDATTTYCRSGRRGKQPAERRRGCGRRPRSRAGARPGARAGPAARPRRPPMRVDRPARGTSPPRQPRARGCCGPSSDDRRRARRPRERLPLRLAEHDRRARLDDGELLGGDLLARLAELLACARARRS